MDRRRVWPDFRESWVLHEDSDFLVVDKPAFVPSQAADAERPDDLVTRARAWLVARGDLDPYLGVHQRLDRDTSGVLVMTRQRGANASLAEQFEGRDVEKRYVACVGPWPHAKERVALEDHLAPGDGGRMQVVSRGTKGAKLAVTQVRVLARTEERTMLELTLETGRTHQARVQLAHAGAPIAGDTLYGGPAAARLLLHARSIAFRRDQKRVRFEAPLPPDFDVWMARGDVEDAVYDDQVLLDRALAHALERRFGLGRGDEGPRATTAFRLVNEGGDALPHLAVDVYGEHLVAQIYDHAAWSDPARRERVMESLGGLGFDGVYLKVRPKQANVIVDASREDRAPAAPVRGTAAPQEITIFEEGIPYLARLGDGLSTGIFLDQRSNRRRVRELAGGQSVLNLFSYTCAFSVAAAVGGAWKTVSVDASAGALARGRENLQRAELLETADHSFVAEDCFKWLAWAKRKGERFDLVLLDPPSYSTTKTTRFAAAQDYAELAAGAMSVLRGGGKLLACSNHRGVSKAKFRRMLFDAGRLAGRDVAQVKDLPDPSDFPPAAGLEAHLKSALVTLSRDK